MQNTLRQHNEEQQRNKLQHTFNYDDIYSTIIHLPHIIWGVALERLCSEMWVNWEKGPVLASVHVGQFKYPPSLDVTSLGSV